MWLSLSFSKSKWLVGVLYRPPSESVNYWNKLHMMATSMDHIRPKFDCLLLVGDFNIDCHPEATHSSNFTHLMEFADSLNLIQLVTDVTRPSSTSTSSGSIIDLIFSDKPHKFTSVESVPNPVSSDHHGIRFALRAGATPPLPSVIRQFLSYSPEAVEHLNALLQYAPWSLFLDSNDVDLS